MQVVVHFVTELMALFETLVVCAHQHDAQIELLEADVHVEHVLLSAARNANRRPRLPIRHRGESHHEVEDHRDVYNQAIGQSEISNAGLFCRLRARASTLTFRFNLIELVCEYVDYIKLCNHHAEPVVDRENCGHLVRH